MNINLKSITNSIINKLQHKRRETASDIVDAIALAELEQVISIMCCDDM